MGGVARWLGAALVVASVGCGSKGGEGQGVPADDGKAAAAATVPPPAPDAQRIDVGAISVDLPAAWKRSGAKGVVIVSPGDPNKDGGVFFRPPEPTRAGAAAVVTAAVATFAQGGEIVVAEPTEPEAGTTPTGLPFARQLIQRKSADGVLHAGFMGLEVGDRVQVVLVLAGSKPAFDQLVGQVTPALMAARPTAAAAAPAPAAGAAAHDPFASGRFAPEKYGPIVIDAKLKLDRLDLEPVWAAEFDTYETQAVQAYRDRGKNVAAVIATDAIGRAGSVVYAFPNGSGTMVKSPITFESAGTFLDPIVKPIAKRLWRYYLGDSMARNMWNFFDLMTDDAGNLYAGATLSGGFDYCLTFRNDLKRYELIATHTFLDQLGGGDGYRGHIWYERACRPSPQGDVWIFIAREEERMVRAAIATRDAAGSWTPTPLPLRITPAPGGRHPSFESLVHGVPDWHGGWVFVSNGWLWRLERGGMVRPIVQLELRLDDTWLSNPLVMKNGDIWIAVVGEYGSSVTTDIPTGPVTFDRHTTFFFTGMMSALLRIRFTSETSITVGGIVDDVLLARLRKAGAKVGEGVFKPSRLRYDFGDDGILLFDTHSHQLLVVKPVD